VGANPKNRVTKEDASGGTIELADFLSAAAETEIPREPARGLAG